jgi:hypothetical protein
MVKKSILMLVFMLFFCEITFSQGTILAQKTDSISTQTDTFLGFDNQKNYYGIKNNVLSKFNVTQHFEYKNVSLGKITRVDFQNPLQIVLFYKDFNTVILLDNQLNEVQKIDFNAQQIAINTEAVALSSQNKLWLYDGIGSKIGLYSFTTASFKWISTALGNPVKWYHANYTHFYWLNATHDFYSISVFGKIVSFGVLPDFDTIQLINDQAAIYSFENQLYYYNITTKSSSKIKIDKKISTNFFFADGILAIFTQNQITNYKIILP